MRVAIISHTYILVANRGKLAALARLPGFQVLVVTPREWWSRDTGQRFRVQPNDDGLLTVRPIMAWSFGYGSLTTYTPVSLWRLLRWFRPHLVHLEEEPWSLASLEVSLICRAMRIPLAFFTWENTYRPLPLPFRLIRRSVLGHARAAVAGNADAKELVGRLGFPKAVTVLPQLGVDTSTLQPVSCPKSAPTVVGYVGRLVRQKGLVVLLEAAARLAPDIRLQIVGNGPFRDEFVERARALNLDGRLELHEGVPHEEVPRYLRQMTVLVLPSLTTPTWKEQFGHVLIEAMACGVPVIGSSSGAIPEVIGDAGVVVPEGDVNTLAEALRRMISEPELRVELATRGRARVLAHYTNESIARRLAGFWQSVLSDA